MHFYRAASLAISLALVCPTDSSERQTSAVGTPRSGANPLPVLAILDPVDVAVDRVLPLYGDLLRSTVQTSNQFAPISRAVMESKMREFAWDSSILCHEFQCGFDAGSMLLSEYVLFGTITALEGIFVYTLNVLHVPSGQVVRAEVGDVSRSGDEGGDAPLKAKLRAFAASLDPKQLDLSRKPRRGLMAVVDLSPESPKSRVLSERVSTHVNASRHYDLMSRKELQELLAAMTIPLHGVEASDSGMIALGTRLNVAYLVQSKLGGDERGYRLDLALFDIAGKRRIRDWPSNSKRDFQEILHHGNRFFSTLKDPSKEGSAKSVPGGGSPRSPWHRGLWSVGGISAAIGLAAYGLVLRHDANEAHHRAESAYSTQSAQAFKTKAQDKDRQSLLFGSLAVLSLGASVVVWTF